MKDTEILIAGAGPSGLVLALSLAKAGIRPRIVDKSSGPGQFSRAMGVQARTLEFYRQMGFADAVLEKGIQVEKINIWVNGKHAAQAPIKDFGEGLSPYPFLLSYPQDEHEKLLVEQLKDAGVEVEWNTNLESFKDIDSGIEVKITKTGGYEERFFVSYLCGCDGAHSAVREGLKLDFGGGTYDKTYFVADVEATGPAADPGSANFCISHEDFMLVFPIRSTGSQRLIGVVPQNIANTEGVTFDDVSQFVYEAANLAITKVNWFSTYKVHHRVTQHFKIGPVFLCGDAGHIHSPVGGQGMNTGIGDAFNLGWKLAAVIQGRASKSILETYEPERITFAHELLSTTDKIFQLMTGTDVGSHVFRDAIFPYVFPFALGFSSVRSQAFKLVSQIKIEYHGSALSRGDTGIIQGGDRLPWVEVDQNVDNFIPLKSLDWQAHVYGQAGHELKAVAHQENIALFEFDWTDAVERSGLQRDALYLVRPDGYIGLCSATQNVVDFRKYLQDFEIKSQGINQAEPPNNPDFSDKNGTAQESLVTVTGQDSLSVLDRGAMGNEVIASGPVLGELARA